MNCSDCGFPTDSIGAITLARGSSVREPGEMVCRSCLSSRVAMTRVLERLPSSLDVIRASRAVRRTA